MRLFVVILAVVMFHASPVQAKHPDYWQPVLKKMEQHPIFGRQVQELLRDFSAIERAIDHASSTASSRRLTVDVIERTPSDTGNPEADILAAQCAISVIDHLARHRYGVLAEEYVGPVEFQHVNGRGVTVGTDHVSILPLQQSVSAYRLNHTASFQDTAELDVLKMVVEQMRDAYALARATIAIVEHRYGDSAILIISPERRASMMVALQQSSVQWTYYEAKDYEAWRRLIGKTPRPGPQRLRARDAKRANDL